MHELVAVRAQVVAHDPAERRPRPTRTAARSCSRGRSGVTPRSNARRRIARLDSSGRSPPKLCQSPSEIAGQLQAAAAAAAVAASGRSDRGGGRTARLATAASLRSERVRLPPASGRHGYDARSCSTPFPTSSQGALGDLRKKGKLDEEAISRAMREIRLALLEADVNFTVVRDFVAHVRERALGEEVLKSLTPGQQVVKIVHDELTELMGDGASELALGKFTRHPARRPAGLGQDDDRREARARTCGSAGPQAGSRRRRPAAAGGDRPARAARRADRRPGLPHRHHRTRSRRRAAGIERARSAASTR